MVGRKPRRAELVRPLVMLPDALGLSHSCGFASTELRSPPGHGRVIITV
jgi:hypothetical protein